MKKYNIEDSKMQRLVLRSLVSYGYNQIKKMFYASNVNSYLSSYEKQIEITSINNYIGGAFLTKDIKACMFCSNTKNWQDYLSADDLFHLFAFQSVIIKNLVDSKNTINSDLIAEIANRRNIQKWVPANIKIENEKIYIPSKESEKRNFIERADVRQEVLTSMVFKNLKEKNFDEDQAKKTKDFIKYSGCFDKFSGLVAESFFISAQKQLNDREEKSFRNEKLESQENLDKLEADTTLFSDEDIEVEEKIDEYQNFIINQQQTTAEYLNAFEKKIEDMNQNNSQQK